MDGSLVPITPPASEPISTAEAKSWARVTTSVDDTLIGGIITAARAHVEEITGRAILTQTWDYFLDSFPYGGLSPLRWTYGSPYAATIPRLSSPFPSGELALPRPILQSVTFVKYTDDTGTVQTLDPTLYQVDTNRVPGRIVPAYGQVWPVARSQPNAVQVRFVAGYAVDEATALAGIWKREFQQLQQAIGVLIATMYDQRESLTDAALLDVPAVFYNLINQYRVWWL